MPTSSPTAAIVIIGNEILSGRTRDENLPYLARRLAELGVVVAEARVVADITEEIVAAVNACRARYSHVFTTGGIGPTHDDITTAAIAAAFTTPVARNAEADRRLRLYYGEEKLNAARLRMADVPLGAVLLDNPVSQAPGFKLENVYVLPGVPSIMQAMFETLAAGLRGGPPMQTQTVSTPLAEGQFAEALGGIQAQYPDVAIGSYPYARHGRYGVSLVLRSFEPERLELAVQAVRQLLAELGGLEDEAQLN